MSGCLPSSRDKSCSERLSSSRPSSTGSTSSPENSDATTWLKPKMRSAWSRRPCEPATIATLPARGPPRPPTGELGGGYMWLEVISLDRLLATADCVRPHAGAVGQHAIDRCEADASLAGDVPERQRAVGVRLLHGLKASRGYLRCATHFEGRDAPKRQPDTGAVVSV